MVLRIIGQGSCLQCGKPTRLRQSQTVKFCSAACGDRYRALSPEGLARAERYNAKRRAKRQAAKDERAAHRARLAEWGKQR